MGDHESAFGVGEFEEPRRVDQQAAGLEDAGGAHAVVGCDTHRVRQPAQMWKTDADQCDRATGRHLHAHVGMSALDRKPQPGARRLMRAEQEERSAGGLMGA